RLPEDDTSSLLVAPPSRELVRLRGVISPHNASRKHRTHLPRASGHSGARNPYCARARGINRNRRSARPPRRGPVSCLLLARRLGRRAHRAFAKRWTDRNSAGGGLRCSRHLSVPDTYRLRLLVSIPVRRVFTGDP